MDFREKPIKLQLNWFHKCYFRIIYIVKDIENDFEVLVLVNTNITAPEEL